MTEVEVKNDRILIKKEDLSKNSLNTQCNEVEALEQVKKVQEKTDNRISNKRDQKALNKLAEKAKYNPNYLLETKNIEDVKLKPIFRPHFGPVY